MNARIEPHAAARDTVPPRLVDALRNPACYPHPVQHFALLETHISWVILTGRYAYKIKKPLRLDFLDFSSLAERRHYCEEELRLNHRLAPDIYLKVVAITGDCEAPQIEGNGPAIEYAVKMREFAQADLLEAALARGALTPALLQSLAVKIAAFHAAAPSALMTSGVNTQAGVLEPALDNFKQILALNPDAAESAALERVRDWTLQEHRRHIHVFTRRLAENRVRECHGDLHLGNIVLNRGTPTPFDCIEFNPALRWIDVISEAAFLMMDLEAHGRRDLAYVFLNAYLEASGDYNGAAVLPFYLVERAMVRAKINLLRASQRGLSPEQTTRAAAAFRRYVTLAASYTQHRPGAIIITHGLSGSGKTTLTEPVLAVLGAVRMRSDVERKRLHGLPALAQTGAATAAGLYTSDSTARVYRQLCEHARSIAGAGFPVIVDATFIKRAQRAMFRALAAELGVRFTILNIGAPREVLRTRVASRAARGSDASEATPAVLEHQIATHEALSADELHHAVTLDAAADPAAAVRAVSGRLIEGLHQ
jgi:aminoglycoside phosphotransferase family enzyme/predicted kinase